MIRSELSSDETVQVVLCLKDAGRSLLWRL